MLLDFKDTELIDLLLFNLPWLCHGKAKAESDVPEMCVKTETLNEGCKTGISNQFEPLDESC